MAASPQRHPPLPGQRWLSEAEPELGLGLVTESDERSVTIEFPAASETRRYALRSAPLARVRFAAGDVVDDVDGVRHRIDAVDLREGLLVYRCRDAEVAEARISSRVALAGPRERLFAGRVDPAAAFDLRLETLTRLHTLRRSPVRGLVGARVELMPHQFYVASEVAARPLPRVLLADETGLGKTIEAGLILSRLLRCGRAARVLVLVPDPLVHQWLVELRRRFQLRFAIHDDKRCAAAEAGDPARNPFAEEPLVLAGLSLVTTSEKRCAQAAEADWDIVVVDEAHHLEWSRDAVSPAYAAVEAIAQRAPGLLLLTATPRQLGEEGHFARLRLLDPDRYGDYGRWLHEAEAYRRVAALARGLLGGEALTAADLAGLAEFLAMDAAETARRASDPDLRPRLVADLLDRHGPGRVMFRNTRAAVRGFPGREVNVVGLDATEEAAAAVQEELRTDLAAACAMLHLGGEPGANGEAEAIGSLEATDDDAAIGAGPLRDDPRVAWLLELLAPPEPRKVLVVCTTTDKVKALAAAIEARRRIDTALFHEDLNLVQRDRQAAWFAEPDGARLMLCSELGSEGRNFQHAQHLVLFDLPLDPDLVEQRIGRLDRIGQRGRVHVHVPFLRGSGMEVLARWLDEGVRALGHPSLVGRPLLERFGDRVRELALAASGLSAAALRRDIEALVADTAAAAGELARQVEEGRDLLLEMASMRADVVDPLLAEVRALDADTDLEDYLLRLLEHFHVYAEEFAPRCVLLNPEGTESPEFPSLDGGQTGLTFAREVALVREDLEFASIDHPLVGDAMELLSSSQSGNAAFLLLASPEAPRLMLEAVFVLETLAPGRLHADRFLPPAPVRVAVDQHQIEQPREGCAEAGDGIDGSPAWLRSHTTALRPVLTKMMEACERLADEQAKQMRRQAAAVLRAQLTGEVERLRALAVVNDHVRPEEIAAVEEELRLLDEAIAAARLRPDALRLVWIGPVQGGEPLLSR